MASQNTDDAASPSTRALAVVLMATHNGATFVEEQVATILAQQGVEIRLVVSDDASTDATPQLLAAMADDPRVTLLPSGRFGSPQANFLRLIRDADVSDADVIALADQDDLWHADKLQRQIALLHGGDYAAVSSNATAFWRDDRRRGRTMLIDKAQPQRRFDYLLEAAGPGCTYVIAAESYRQLRRVLVEHPLVDPRVPHDWLLYAVARARGMRWLIDSEPTIDYRQHGANATGANAGARQALVRARRLARGSYRRQALAVGRLALAVAVPSVRPALQHVVPLFEQSSFATRRALRRLSRQLRRSDADRRLLRAALTLGIW